MLETSSPVVINTDGLKTKPSASCDSTIERWRVADIVALFELPFSDLMYQARTVHRANSVSYTHLTLPTIYSV